MVQKETATNQLTHENGNSTKKKLEKKGLTEPKYLRMIKADSRSSFGCNEPFKSVERDKQLAEAWIEKVGRNKIRIT